MAKANLSRSVLIGVIVGLVVGALVGMGGAALDLPVALRGGITGVVVVVVLSLLRTRIVGAGGQASDQ